MLKTATETMNVPNSFGMHEIVAKGVEMRATVTRVVLSGESWWKRYRASRPWLGGG